MEHRPFISVIIPVWNGARYLDACLNSILRQSWQHFEIIIVDDGSRDATWDMLMRWKKQDARIVPFHQENAGVSEARNTAMRHASGDYYRFVDVDDQLPPDSLEQLVRCAEKNQSDLVLAAYTEVLGTTRTVRDLGKCTDTVESAEFLRRLERLSNSFYYGVLWNKLYRRDLIRMAQIRFENVVFAEDQLFNTEYLRYVRTAVSIPDIGYYYLQCSQSVSHSRVTTADILRLRRRVMLLYRDIYTELGIYPETRAAILRSPFGENEFTLPPLDTPQTHCCKL